SLTQILVATCTNGDYIADGSTSLGAFAITTSATPTTETVGGAPLKDTAYITVRVAPIAGTMTFKLTSPSNTVVDTKTVNVSGIGPYTTPTGYVPTQVGTYYWQAFYSGNKDSSGNYINFPKNSGATDEPVVVTPASPAINAIAGGTVVIGSGTTLSDE